jgi:aspartokinase
MPKLKNVTTDEIKAAQSASEDVISTLQDLNDRMQKGYHDHIESPAELARHFNALSRNAGEMVSALLITLAMQEMKAETEALKRMAAGK